MREEDSEMIRVGVLGACGKLGSEVVRAVAAVDDMKLVGACDVVHSGRPVGDVVGVKWLDIPITSDFGEMLNESSPNVIVDVAKPFKIDNTRAMLKQGVVPVIGTTGLSSAEVDEIGRLAGETGVAAMVIPNFAIGAVLMMKFAAEAAKYMSDVEIIELHRDTKIDAPSGTAIKTAEGIGVARKAAGVEAVAPLCADGPARGERHSGVPVHSVRLPGLVAHQEVIFGGMGQALTIRHDSMDWTSFMPGVLLAIRRASVVRGLIRGLDELM